MSTSLTSRTLMLSVGSVLQKSSGMITVLFLVRLLDKGMYGTYQQVIYVAGIVYGLFASGFAASIYYFLPRLDLVRRARFVRQTTALMAALGLASSISVYAFGPEISRYFNNPDLARALEFYALYVFFWIGNDYFLPFLNASGRYRLSVLCGVVESISNTIFLVLPLWGGIPLNQALGVLALLAGVRFVAYFVITRRVVGSAFGGGSVTAAEETVTVRKQLRYSLPLMASGWTDLLGNYLDKIIVSLFSTPATVAIYAIGTIRIPIWDMVAKPVNIVLRVKFAELVAAKREAEIRAIWHEAVRKQSMVVVPIVAFLWVAADHLIPLLFTNAYIESVSVFRIYLLDKPMLIMSFSVFPLVMGRPDILLKGSIVFVSANAVLMSILATQLGLYGPISAVILAQYVHYGFYTYMIVRKLKVPIGTLFPGPVLLRVFGANLVAGVCAFSAALVFESHLLALVIAAGTYGLVYLAGLRWSGALRSADIRAVLHLMPFYRRSAAAGGVSSGE